MYITPIYDQMSDTNNQNSLYLQLAGLYTSQKHPKMPLSQFFFKNVQNRFKPHSYLTSSTPMAKNRHPCLHYYCRGFFRRGSEACTTQLPQHGPLGICPSSSLPVNTGDTNRRDRMVTRPHLRGARGTRHRRQTQRKGSQVVRSRTTPFRTHAFPPLATANHLAGAISEGLTPEHERGDLGGS